MPLRSLRSPPALNTRPAPVRMTQCTPLPGAATRAHMSRISRPICVLVALLACGRFSVTTSVPVSVSVVSMVS